MRSRSLAWLDVVAAAILAAGFLVEYAIADIDHTPWLDVPFALLVCGPVAVRRRFPLAAPATTLTAAVLLNLVGTSVEETIAPFFAVLLNSYATGAFLDGRRSWAGLAVGVCGVVLVVATFPGESTSGDYLFPAGFVLACWIAGRAVRSRTLLTAELHEAAVLADEQRQAAARRAAADERRRIAREMHDIVAHSVSVMVVQAGGARRILDRDPGRAVAAAAEIERTGREALGEMRRLLGVLHVGEREAARAPQPTLEGVPTLVERAREAGLPVDLQVQGEPRALPAGLDLAAYRIVQEALTNAIKHAGAAPTAVSVRYGDHELELEVVDAGRAARSAPGPGLASGGHGIVGMRERVRLYGGELRAGRRPDGGFEVWARIPLEAQEVAAA